MPTTSSMEADRNDLVFCFCSYTAMEDARLIPVKELELHNEPEDCWLVIEDQVWDFSAFATSHPGGEGIIYKYAGKDATKAFLEIHDLSILRDQLPLDCYKGTLDISTVDPALRSSNATATAASDDLSEKPPLHTILNSYDFDEVASRTASKKAYAFYSTAATDCWTRDTNERMLKRIWFRPRVMRDVSKVDTSSTVLGTKMSIPLFICPTGLAKLINPEAEKALARAAKSTGILEILSTSASHPLDTILASAPNYPFLFQLYLNKDRAKSAALLRRMRSLGMLAIFLTVDAAGRGKRESDERLRVDEIIENPVTGEKASLDPRKRGGLTHMMGSFIDQGMTWEAIPWIRQQTDLPIVLKGITTAADAKLAMEAGVDGIMLSNHGGRNLDFAPPSILLLLEMHKCCPEVFERMDVFVDGGFRRGGDILKALCLGAKAVGIGRTFLYALHYGQEGAEHLIELLKDEMESVMKLVGIKDLSEVHPGLVNTSDVDHLVPDGTEHPYIKWRPRPRL